MHDQAMISFEQLTKSYGTFDAVKPMQFDVARGEVFGFLGPNGAGKTTTIRMMMGILVPSSGRVLVAGLDAHLDRAEVQRHVGYLPDNPIFYDFLRGREILQFVAEMHGFSRPDARSRAAALLDELGLSEASDEYAVNFSLGMKKRLGLACALIHDPEVLILDEPINGLDPRASRDVQERIGRSAQAGKTIFVSTHQLDIAERICSRIGIIAKGSMVAIGSSAELKERGQPGGTLEDVFLEITRESDGEALEHMMARSDRQPAHRFKEHCPLGAAAVAAPVQHGRRGLCQTCKAAARCQPPAQVLARPTHCHAAQSRQPLAHHRLHQCPDGLCVWQPGAPGDHQHASILLP